MTHITVEQYVMSHYILYGITNDPWRHMRSSKWLLKVLSNQFKIRNRYVIQKKYSLTLLLTHHESCWLIIAHGDSLWRMVTHHESWWLIMAHGDSPWRILTPHDSWWLIATHGESSWHIVTHHDSWRLMVFHGDWLWRKEIFCHFL